MRATFTVYFEGPFWVGVLESEPVAGQIRAARHVFGAEPSNAELLAYMLDRFSELAGAVSGARAGSEAGAAARPGPYGPCFSASAAPASLREAPCRRPNPKRALREAARDASRPPSTKAQAALVAEREAFKAAASSRARARREELAERRFRPRAGKRREKRRGH